MNKYDSIKGLTADFNSVEEKRGGGGDEAAYSRLGREGDSGSFISSMRANMT